MSAFQPSYGGNLNLLGSLGRYDGYYNENVASNIEAALYLPWSFLKSLLTRLTPNFPPTRPHIIF